MGSNCSHHDEPDQSNVCSPNVILDQNTFQGRGDQYERNFCTLYGIGGDSYREDFCEHVGKDEWISVPDGGNIGCKYNDCDNRTNYGSGCCNGCCGILGQTAKCQRSAYNADPLTCCFNDYVCSGTDYGDPKAESCFENSDRRITCAPQYRSAAFPECRDKISEFCAPSNDDSLEWVSRWYQPNYPVTAESGTVKRVDAPCAKAIYRNLYSKVNLDSPPNIQKGVTASYPKGREDSTACDGKYSQAHEIDAQGYAWSQNLLNQAIEKYVSQGGNLTGQEGSNGSNQQFNTKILEICRQYPGLCSKSLRSLCSSTTISNIEKHVGLLTWCGCHMQDSQYSKYTDLYQINKECTPMCNQVDNIPLEDITGIRSKTCQQNICLIDDIAIRLAESKVGGTGEGIRFSQICSACGTSSTTAETVTASTCSCMISNLNIDAVKSKIGSINISQNCGSSKCYSEISDNGITRNVEVPCDNAENYDPYISYKDKLLQAEKTAIDKQNRNIIILIVSILLILLILYFIFRPRPILETLSVLERAPGGSDRLQSNHVLNFRSIHDR